MAEENSNSTAATTDSSTAAAANTTDDASTKKTDDGSATKKTTKDEAADDKHPGWANITTTNVADAVGIRDLNGIMGDVAAMKARQHLLDPKKYKKEYKKPNPGKMPNNKDPFPVDLKIEEFECHYPPTQIYQLKTHKEGAEAGAAAMGVGENAEKRLIKLENNLSTLFRLFFRLGTRVPINCMYYGGQTPFEKYKGIRCLCDDRISDGQEIQIDQCLTCTRFEPVFGQCYEIMNDLGANVAGILDDNQASYGTMQDYVDLTRIERFHEEKKNATFDLNTVETRSGQEKDFDTAWGAGIKMDWHYVPRDEQKTHINWRQSINDDGKNLKRLDSFPCSAENGVSNVVAGKGAASLMKKNKEAMDSFSPKDDDDRVVQSIISGAKDVEGMKDDCLNAYRGGNMKTVKAACAGVGLDALTVATIGFATGSEDYNSIIAKLNDLKNAIGTSNPAILVAAYGTCQELFLGKENDAQTPRIDMAITPPGSKDGGKDSKKEDDGVTLDWNSKDSWLWTDFAKRFVKRAGVMGFTTAQCALFPKVCYLYCVVYPECKNSCYDEDDFGFPFFDDQFSTGINYSSPYGWRESFGRSRMHYGIDLGADGGLDIHAVADGTVVEDGTGESWGPWHGVCIQHDDGSTYSRYLHCSSMSVSAGQHVSRGDIIAQVGGYGPEGPGSYDTHLHLEISPGDAVATKSPNDPASYFPKFQAAVSVGSPLEAM